MLNEIVSSRKKQVAEMNFIARIDRIMPLIECLPPVRSLKTSLTRDEGVSLIAEVKRRSPSKGVLNRDLEAAATASIYQASGAAGISVLTEPEYFHGNIDDLMDARWATDLPVLRKDFIVDAGQVYESRLIGADVILLIVAILSHDQLTSLYSLAHQLGLEVLLEVHSEQELTAALKLTPDLIGINNRDLKTFEIDLGTTERLASMLPDTTTSVSESGIHNRDDILRLQAAGVDAVLVGEELVCSADPGRRIKQLLGVAHDQD
ncbi:MAG: indole-3-glycerol phosphate synthase TrpC [bacterium]